MASFAPAWARGLGPGSDVHVSESEAETAEDETEGESEEEGVPLHSCDAIALRFFQTVAIVTEAVAVLSAVTNGAALVLQPTDFKEGVLRLYAIVFSALIIAAELDAERLLKDLSILDNWLCRGVFYSFVGLLCLDVDTGRAEPAAGAWNHTLRYWCLSP